MAKVFFSYSHKDEALRDELEKHLTILKRQGFIETWHDRRIGAGEELAHEISQNLETADIILLLVSSDFLASDYCYDIEMTQAIARHKVGLARVIPIILRPCDWHDAPFGKLLATPPDGKPVMRFPTLDDAFVEVVAAIKLALGQMGQSKSPTPPAAALTEAQPDLGDAARPRSSNLRIKKEFSDRDLDKFRLNPTSSSPIFSRGRFRNWRRETRILKLISDALMPTILWPRFIGKGSKSAAV